MGIITRMRKQVCLYWKYNGADVYGADSYDDVVELTCRWDDKTELIKSDLGKEEVSNATVYPQQRVFPRDVLWLGTIDDYPGDLEAPLEGAYGRRVLKCESIPNLKNTETLHIARL